jgi:hypothetical protein
MKKVPGTFLWALVPALLLLTIQSFADSHVRIVRLSDVVGDVQIDRNLGQGFEKAFLNLPITEGATLRTQIDGRAEIEFENGVTLRIAPLTEIHFDQLSLADSGIRNSSISLAHGLMYVNSGLAPEDAFSIHFEHQTVKLDTPAHFRLEMDNDGALLSVFSGQVHVQNPSGDVVVNKNQTGSFDFAKQDSYQLAKGVEKRLFDNWDKSEAKYHDEYLKNASYKNLSPYSYGLSDLNYYGNFINVPAYGWVWQPHLVGAGWNPFARGRWVWYPGVGWVWVSDYPWGWMPFYYGSWGYDDSFGWFWNPQSTWQSWNYTPVVVSSPPVFKLPRPPARPPIILRGGGGHTIVVVNQHPVPVPNSQHKPVPPNKIVVRNDSAGLGVPRGTVRNWNKVTAEVQRNGSVTANAPTTSLPVFLWSQGFRDLPENGKAPQNPGLSAYHSAGNNQVSAYSSSRGASSYRGSGSTAMRGTPAMSSSSSSSSGRSSSSMSSSVSSAGASSSRSSGNSAPSSSSHR